MSLFRIISFLILFLVAGSSFAQIRFNSGSSFEMDYTNPRKFEIGGITVSGAKFLDTDALISITGLKVGDQITVPGDQVSKAIQKLWDQGILGDIEVTASKIEGNYIFLDFKLTERPRLSKFTFTGISKSNADDLREKIRLIRGKVVTESLVDNTRSTVRKYYIGKGFMNVKVNIRQERDSTLANSVILIIDVDKKKKVKIGNITFAGNESIPDNKLKKSMRNSKEKRFYKLLTSSKFIRSGYEEDKLSVVNRYNAEGFRDAFIISDTVYTADNGRLNIHLEVDEGPKYYFRNITWTGNYIYDDNYLSSILGIKKGTIYSKDILDKRLNYNPSGLDITSLYMDDGYLFFSIDPEEILVEGDSIDIEMRIYEGAQARINAVNVSGNTKTSDHVILRELRTVPGQKFSRSDLIRSQRELAQLGYFDPEQIGINPIPNQAEGTVDINYTVVEKPSDQITLSGGWGGGLGAVGTVGLVFNNFSMRKIGKFKEWGGPLPSGDGQRLALNAQASGLRYQSYSLSFTEPWLGGRKPNSFTVSLNRSIQNIIRGTEREGSLKMTGASVSLGRRLRIPDDFFVLSHTVSYYRYDYNNYAVFPGLSNGASHNISFVNTLSRNSIDNPTYPRRGSAVSLSLNLTPPYSLFDQERDGYKWIEFHKWMFDAQWYMQPVQQLAPKLVLNARAHFGFIGRYRPEVAIGPFERFELGGSGLGGFGGFLLGTEFVGLRGYDDRSLNANGFRGVAYNKFVMEMRYPLSLAPTATVYLLAFAEGGNNVANYEEFNPFNLYRSAGVGARIFMPAFGLIGFDWGYGFDEVPYAIPGHNKGQFHFMIGQQFR